MKQIEVINLETIIDVTAETSNVEILVQDNDSELAERFALEAQEAAIDAEESADIATAQASIATAQAGIATTQAGIATTQAGNALTSANNAAASAQEAQDIVDSIITADLTEATSSVLTITGGTDAVLGTGTTIQVKQAGSSQSGFLSSTDWTTFNSKQDTITNPVTGTGASGQVAFWNGTSSQTGNSGLTWNNTTKTLSLRDSTDTYGSNIATVSFNTEISSPGSLFVNVGSSVLRGLQIRRGGENVWNIGGSGNIVSTTAGAGTGASIYAGSTGAFGFWSVGSTLASNVIYLNNRTNNDNYGVRLAYRNAGTEATGLALQNNGNVLINTTTDAGFRLDVNGTARVQGELTVGNGTDSIIRANSSISGGVQTTFIQASAANTSTMIEIRPSGSNSSMTGFYLRDSATAANNTNTMVFGRGNATLPSTGVNYIGNIVNAVASANSFHIGFLVSNTSAGRIEAARIWNSGNVLIQAGGTYTDAGFRLDVQGSTRFNGLSTIQGTTASDSGQLGAELLTTGTGDASWTGTSFATGYTHVAGSTTTLTSTLAGVVGTFYQITYTVTGRTAGSFTIGFGGFTSVPLTATGAVGPQASTTGTLVITPTSDFNGTIVLSIRVITVSSASVSFTNSSGTVTNHIRINSLNTNTFIGLNSGRNNTTGAANSFFGSNAGQANTTGESNTAIGRQSLFTNTTGGFNTAIGINSLFNNTTGSTNTAVGSFTGKDNTTGASNSFFGHNSGQANTTGAVNSFFGTNSGLANTTGSSNSFFGQSSGQANTTGASNSFFGENSGFSNSNASSNSFFGHNSGFSNTTGQNNIGVGRNAGRFAGSGTTPMTSVNNSIYLGFQTRGLNATGSTNEVVIGYDVVGLGSNTTVLGNSSTTHGRWYGSLLLGTTTNAASSILTMESTTQGFLPPRMTTTQRNAIASPATGLVVYDNTLNKLSVFTGLVWETVTSL
jgi:hypothetical protein